MSDKRWLTGKTVGGCVIIAGGAVLKFLGYAEIADAVIALGGALGLLGARHAIAKGK